MAPQYPYNQPQQYSPNQHQYPPQQQQLYPPYQSNSRPASPYQQPAQPYQPQSYPPQRPPSRTPSPYAPNAYHQQQQQSPPLPQGYQPFPPQQSYPPPQGYPAPAYPALQPTYQPQRPYHQADSSPPPQRQPSHQQGPYTLIFASTGKHTKTLTPQNSSQPSYIAHYNRPLIASSKPAITIITPGPKSGGGGTQLATAEWHTWSGKIDLCFASTGTMLTYKDNFESSTLGRLFWTLTQGDKNQADLKCADRAGQAICTVILRDKLENGRIEIWRPDINKQQVDEIVVSAIAEIEDLRRKMEDSGKLNYGQIGAIAAMGGP